MCKVIITLDDGGDDLDVRIEFDPAVSTKDEDAEMTVAQAAALGMLDWLRDRISKGATT